MITDLLSELRQVPEFANVPEDQLRWLTEKGSVKTFEDGAKLFRPGDRIDDMRIILSGGMNIYREQAGSLRFYATFEKREITGLLPYSRMKEVRMEAIAQGTLEMFTLDKEHFPEMISRHYALTEALVHTMTDRVRYFTQQQQQDEKMMALGKLSAGLAHELNNPSAAVVRTAQELKKHLSNIPDKFKAVIKIQTTEAIVDQVNNLVFSKIAENGKNHLSLTQKTNREDALVGWLENNGIDNAYELAENYTQFNIVPEDLERLKSVLRPEDKAAVLDWISQVLLTERLVSEIQEASKRINALVTSIKRYTHMDQASEKQRADIHEGIQSTLTMLNHKVKQNQVKVLLHFEPTLPQANIYISGLNQVWTNLLDNALDAMEGRSDNVLEIRTQRNNEFIWVSFIDNGVGIPETILGRIFDPFFTTKPIGKGTGLGLEVARQIINQHDGKIDVTSVPGRTEFKVCIPIG